jgi:hypothetical protein
MSLKQKIPQPRSVLTHVRKQAVNPLIRISPGKKFSTIFLKRKKSAAAVPG